MYVCQNINIDTHVWCACVCLSVSRTERLQVSMNSSGFFAISRRRSGAISGHSRYRSALDILYPDVFVIVCCTIASNVRSGPGHSTQYRAVFLVCSSSTESSKQCTSEYLYQFRIVSINQDQ